MTFKMKEWISKVTSAIQTLTTKVNAVPKFAHGYAAVGQISANSYKDVTITHNLGVYAHVVATMFSSGTAVNIGAVTITIHDITATTAQIRVFNNRSTTLNPGIEWIAIA